MQSWFVPKSGGLVSVDIDLKVGGKWCFVIEKTQEKQIHFEGEYLAIDAPNRLEFSWRHVQEFADGNGQMPRLVEVMDGISSGAIENYLDKTVGNLELGRINRGLVSGARATIKKASASSVEKGIPAMEKSHQKPVVAYFESLLLQP